MSFDNIDFGHVSLTVAIAAAVAAWVASALPPNPGSEKTNDKSGSDRIIGPFEAIFHFSTSGFRAVAILGNAAVVLSHALLIFSYPKPPAIMCPQQNTFARLSNPLVFTWNPLLATILAVMIVFASIRVASFRNLGMSFTFNLAKPDGLVKHGIHGWVQHPSYTGFIPTVFGMIFIYIRFDGYAACFLPEPWLDFLIPIQSLVASTVALSFFTMIWMRVIDEEKMLKDAFGKEWEDYHRSTKRFVPLIW